MKASNRSAIVVFFVLALTLVSFSVALTTASPALAAPESAQVDQLSQAQEEPEAPSVADLDAEFLFFLVTLTGFIKARFGVRGNKVLLLGIGVGLFLYLYPYFIPQAGTIVTAIVEFLKWIIAGAGSFDTLVDVGSKAAAYQNTSGEKAAR